MNIEIFNYHQFWLEYAKINFSTVKKWKAAIQKNSGTRFVQQSKTFQNSCHTFELFDNDFKKLCWILPKNVHKVQHINVMK